ncbi:hypothetical protein J6590_030863 [Homalodisca vitripennis]|nr:hypothetical protein J6590_030863 [Homalodisca vitripennis]
MKADCTLTGQHLLTGEHRLSALWTNTESLTDGSDRLLITIFHVTILRGGNVLCLGIVANWDFSMALVARPCHGLIVTWKQQFSFVESYIAGAAILYVCPAIIRSYQAFPFVSNVHISHTSIIERKKLQAPRFGDSHSIDLSVSQPTWLNVTLFATCGMYISDLDGLRDGDLIVYVQQQALSVTLRVSSEICSCDTASVQQHVRVHVCEKENLTYAVDDSLTFQTHPRVHAPLPPTTEHPTLEDESCVIPLIHQKIGTVLCFKYFLFGNDVLLQVRAISSLSTRLRRPSFSGHRLSPVEPGNVPSLRFIGCEDIIQDVAVPKVPKWEVARRMDFQFVDLSVFNLLKAWSSWVAFVLGTA